MSMMLSVSIDVEEEGLFRNRFQTSGATTENVPWLKRLDSLFQEFGIRPTLLVTFQVANHPEHRDLLADLRERWHGEIGAHLHSWNTPPLVDLPYPDPVPSECVPRDILAKKLDTLLDAIGHIAPRPRSFRMGRYNLGPKMLDVLEQSEIQTDSSIAPMRKQYGGADHLDAPIDPYRPDSINPCKKGESRLVEVPITVVPLTRNLGRQLVNLENRGFLSESATSWLATNVGSLPVQPMWTGLRRMKTAVRIHKARGGKVLSIFFHSSELMPCGCPKHKTEGDINRFLEKLRAFFTWLDATVGFESVTIDEIGGRHSAGV